MTTTLVIQESFFRKEKFFMLNFNIVPLIWLGLAVLFAIVIFVTSKWGIKKLFSIFKVDEEWYKALNVIYSTIKVCLVAGGIIFIASRILFHDVTIKSYNTDVQNMIEENNQKMLNEAKPIDPNEIERLNKLHELEHKQEVEDNIRKRQRTEREEFQQFLDTL